jgi:hypothetical protein
LPLRDAQRAVTQRDELVLPVDAVLPGDATRMEGIAVELDEQPRVRIYQVGSPDEAAVGREDLKLRDRERQPVIE